MSHRIFRRTVAVLCSGLLGLGALMVSAAPSGAAQGKTTLPVTSIVMKSNDDVNAIRTYFFCQTATCKKSVVANLAAATAGLHGIVVTIGAMKSDKIPKSEKAIVAKYESDATALVSAYEDYPTQDSANGEANNIGIIYYQTSNLNSDDYVMSCVATKTPVNFKTWSVGVVGVAYAMQVDTQAESTATTKSVIKSANESLLAEATSLKADANGPSAKFNKLIVQFASTQALDSKDSLAVLAGKDKHITPATLKALAATLTSEFKVIAQLQNKLAT